MTLSSFDDFQEQWEQENPEHVDALGDITRLGFDLCLMEFHIWCDRQILSKASDININEERQDVIIYRLSKIVRKDSTLSLTVSKSMIKLFKQNDFDYSYYTCDELISTPENKEILNKICEFINAN